MQGDDMKRAMITTVAVIAAAFFQTIAYAEVDDDWAKAKLKANACLTCHAIDKKKFGPSYKSLSRKFKGKTPDDMLARWGAFRVHTGVRTQIGDEDLKLVFEWILTLRTRTAARERK
jgi:cytochrome c